ncbi:hypothetical protein [Candidatus Albibeggiatoa sp. nov. BB20]|uniref:hypothetical protein n=1 Tax=Candidatus Albibeggiatoa sp. nov. BB20 TaxID=3162723 RepID=UPI00336585CC
MQNTSEPAYWEIVNNSLWKQQNIIEFINETIGDLYIGENPEDLRRAETCLTAIDALVDSLKGELREILPLVHDKRDALL